MFCGLRGLAWLALMLYGLLGTEAGATVAPPVPLARGAALEDSPAVQALGRVPDAAELDAFFGALIPYALRQAGIPGAAVVVVKEDRVLFAHGYGFADLGTRTSVSPETTLFRQGSVSKLLTWTAVMQLVEQDRLDLDADVNQYLDFRIPTRFRQPIRLRDLLMHTAGFEELPGGIMTFEASRYVPLGEYLRGNIPKRIFPPGERIAYSNYGAALAGYIVERVSGEPFAEYIQHHIFDVLGMRHSTFEQPVPEQLTTGMARSYDSVAGAVAQPFVFVQPTPAGAMSATPEDMGRFMIAHLQGGVFEGRRILEAQTIAQMHARHFQAAPGRNGFCLGFWEAYRNGWRVIGHSGDIPSFHASLFLVPAAGYGILVQLSGNGEQGRKRGSDVVRTAIVNSFLDRYVPGVVPDEPTLASAARDADKVAGRYETTRRNESVLRVLAAFQDEDTVSASSDGTIEISSRLADSGVPKRWREVGPLVYREVGGQAHVSFVVGATGNVSYWISDDYPPAMVYERLHGIRGRGWLRPLMVFSIGVGLAVCVAAALSRGRRTRAQRLWIASRVGYGVQTFVVLSWLIFAAFGLSGVIDGGSHAALKVISVASVAAVGVAFVSLIPIFAQAMVAVRRKSLGVIVRGAEIVSLLTAAFLAWFMACYGVVAWAAS